MRVHARTTATRSSRSRDDGIGGADPAGGTGPARPRRPPRGARRPSRGRRPRPARAPPSERRSHARSRRRRLACCCARASRACSRRRASRSSPRPATPRTCCARSAPTSPTWRSSTCACRRRTPTRACAPPPRSASAIPETGVLVLSQYVEEALRAGAAGRQRRRARLPAQGPRRRPRPLHRRGAPRRRGRLGARPRGRLAAARPPPPRRPARRAHAARARGARLMAEGRSNHAIAEQLVVTERAVEKHVTSIFAKLGLPPTPDDHRRVLAVLRLPRSPHDRRSSRPSTSPAATARARRRSTPWTASTSTSRPARFTADHGPVGLRQVDAHAHPRRARPPDVGDGRARRRRARRRSTTRRLTELRRDKVGFVFQAFNLLPVLTAEENILLPLSIAGRKPDREWFDQLIDTVGLRRPADPPPGRAVAAASSSASRSRARWPRGPRWSSPTSRPATSTRTPSTEVLELLRRSVDEFGQTVVMVTHDPTPPRSPTASSSWPTAASSTTAGTARRPPDAAVALRGPGGAPAARWR